MISSLVSYSHYRLTNMKKILLTVLICTPMMLGCHAKKEAPIAQEKIVATGREREVLRAYGLSEDSEAGQKRLRRMRDRDEQLEAARERMETLADRAAEREAEEAALED